MHVYLVATKKSYLGNNKHIEANAQALEALRASLDKKYLHVFLTMIPLLQYETF